MSDGVGYKNPPKHGQFKKGQSGNPSGRPKGTRNLCTDLQEELNEKIAVREGTHTQKISKQRVLAKTLVNKALQGDMRAMGVLMPLILRHLGEGQVEDLVTNELGSDDKKIIENYTMRLQKQTKGHENA